jgi:hypothetical protein
MAIERITFVWNADFSVAGGLRALKEALEGHHSCTLCAIAYHRVTQTSAWTAYKTELAGRLRAEIREPCRNQLTAEESAAAASDYPTVLAHTATGVTKLLGSEDIDRCNGEFSAFRAMLDAAIGAHAS